MLTGAMGMAGNSMLALSGQHVQVKNSIPKWKGFNLQDFFSPDPRKSRRQTAEQDLQWMADWGFDFIRIPMAYPAYLDIDRSRDIGPDDVYNISEKALEKVDRLVFMAHRHNLRIAPDIFLMIKYWI